MVEEGVKEGRGSEGCRGGCEGGCWGGCSLRLGGGREGVNLCLFNLRSSPTVLT